MRKLNYIFTIIFLIAALQGKAQVQIVSGGTGSAYTLVFPGAFAYTAGISVTFKAHLANTGAATININTLGAIAINKNSSQPLVAGDIAINQFVTLIYDGSVFQMVTPSSAPTGFANTSLSNLTPTSVNQSLIPDVNNSRNLGSNSIFWEDLWMDGKLYISGAPWTSTSTNNTLIGTKGGEAFTSGLYNLGVGQGSGNSITTGFRNTAVGHRAGELLTTQSDNTFIGNLAGGLAPSVGNDNTFVGSYAGYGNTNTGARNTFIGVNTGGNNTSGNNNTYLGSNTAYIANSGGFNTALGSESGQNLTTGNTNTFVGYYSGFPTATQRTNATAIGANAIVDADNAVVLGNNANVGIGIPTPGKLTGSSRYLSLAAVTTGVTNGTAALELIGNTGSLNTMASKIDFLGLVPVTNIASQRARIEAKSGASQTLAGQLTFWTNNGTNDASIFERMRITEAGRVGIGTANPATSSLFAVGSTSQFQVSSTGDLVRINNVPMAWPASNVAGVLQNDGLGSLIWSPVSGSAWSLIGNGGTVDGTNYIGTSDNIPFNIRVNNQKSGRITSGGQTFFGYLAGANNTGSTSTAYGANALTAASAVGTNTAIGYNSMAATTTGFQNVALGYNSLVSNTGGSNNVAVGYVAMGASTSGSQNVAIGQGTLASTTNTSNNTAVGHQALYNSNGNNNTSLGYQAGLSNTTGTNNLFLGYNADASGNFTNATAIGANAVVSQGNAIVLGNNADVGIGTSTPRAKLDVRDVSVITTGTLPGNLHVMSTNPQATDLGGSISLGGYYDDAATGVRMFATMEGRKSNATSTNAAGYLSIKTNNGAGLLERMRIDAAGNIGIGTTTPTAKLDVVGDVQVPAANDYTYATAKTKTLVVPAVAFNNNAATLAYGANGNNITITGGGSVYAPLNLPIGAIITNLRWVIVDADALNSNTGVLQRLLEGSGTPTSIATSTSVDNGAINNHQSNPAHTVLGTSSYWLRWTSTSASQILYMCFVTYTVTQAE